MMLRSLVSGLVLLLAVLFCLAAGCTATLPGARPTSLPIPAPADPVLTNEGSPSAAAFSGGSSVTPLGPGMGPVGLERFATGFSSPMMLAFPGDGTNRIIVVEQTG